MSDIARLRELASRATQGEWAHKTREEWGYGTKSWIEPIQGEPFGPVYASEQALIDHEYIAAMHNALPGLLDRLEKLEQVAYEARFITPTTSEGLTGLYRALDELDEWEAR